MKEILLNGFVQSLLAAVAFGLLVWIIQTIRFGFDESKIIDFLKNSNKTFRSTQAIVSAVNLVENRVQYICASSKKIKRNQKEKESWRLT